MQQYPDMDAQLKQTLQVLGDIDAVAGNTPASVGESAEWAAIVNDAEENGANYCKDLHAKPLFSALYGTYTVSLDELKAVLKTSTPAGQINSPEATGQQTTQEDGFRSMEVEAARHRRNRRTSKKAALQNKT
jgi:hypothetical protein